MNVTIGDISSMYWQLQYSNLIKHNSFPIPSCNKSYQTTTTDQRQPLYCFCCISRYCGRWKRNLLSWILASFHFLVGSPRPVWATTGYIYAFASHHGRSTTPIGTVIEEVQMQDSVSLNNSLLTFSPSFHVLEMVRVTNDKLKPRNCSSTSRSEVTCFFGMLWLMAKSSTLQELWSRVELSVHTWI